MKKDFQLKLPKYSAKEIHRAAVVLGTSAWVSQVERLTPEQLAAQQSKNGKLGGRPRKDGA